MQSLRKLFAVLVPAGMIASGIGSAHAIDFGAACVASAQSGGQGPTIRVPLTGYPATGGEDGLTAAVVGPTEEIARSFKASVEHGKQRRTKSGSGVPPSVLVRVGKSLPAGSDRVSFNLSVFSNYGSLYKEVTVSLDRMCTKAAKPVTVNNSRGVDRSVQREVASKNDDVAAKNNSSLLEKELARLRRENRRSSENSVAALEVDQAVDGYQPSTRRPTRSSSSSSELSAVESRIEQQFELISAIEDRLSKLSIYLQKEAALIRQQKQLQNEVSRSTDDLIDALQTLNRSVEDIRRR